MFELNNKQLSNLEEILVASEEFNNDAEIGFEYPSYESNAIVIESGHQPNFFPHAGLWKKIFLIDHLRRRFEKKGMKPIVLFGFSDYDLCTAQLHTLNKIPACNKLGYKKFGFNIEKKDIWKRFNTINKPEEKEWKKIINDITTHFDSYSIPPEGALRLNGIIDIMKECFAKATNFSDLNAFFITKIAHKFDIKVHFFRYSDIQKKCMFTEIWNEIITKISQYNTIYNTFIEKNHIDIPYINPELLPLWYHCSCGGKVKLMQNGEYAIGNCRICASKYKINLHDLNKIIKDTSPNAIARNIIFSEGLGTHVFISGTGGSQVYGRISKEISKEFGLNSPVNVSWKSRDWYIGPAHKKAIRDLRKTCFVEGERNLKEDIDIMINEKKNILKNMIANSSDNHEIEKYKEQYRSLATSISIIKTVFKTTPSFIDILISQEFDTIKELWCTALNNITDIEQKNNIDVDIIYSEEALITNEKLENLNG